MSAPRTRSIKVYLEDSELSVDVPETILNLSDEEKVEYLRKQQYEWLLQYYQSDRWYWGPWSRSKSLVVFCSITSAVFLLFLLGKLLIDMGGLL